MKEPWSKLTVEGCGKFRTVKVAVLSQTKSGPSIYTSSKSKSALTL